MNSTTGEMERAEPAGVGFWQTVWSVLAAFYGVQSTRHWQRDFSQGNALRFILVGLGLTTLFVFALLGVVRLILSHAGA